MSEHITAAEALALLVATRCPGDWYRVTEPDGDSDNGPNGEYYPTRHVACDSEPVADCDTPEVAAAVAALPQIVEALEHMEERHANAMLAVLAGVDARAELDRARLDISALALSHLTVPEAIGELNRIGLDALAHVAEVGIERDRLARILAVERGDWREAPSGWEPRGADMWVRGTRPGRPIIQRFHRDGQPTTWTRRGEIDGPHWPTALEAMEAINAAGVSNG